MQCKNCKNSIEVYPCRYCGFDGDDGRNPHYLSYGHELADGKYVIGRVIGAGGFGVTYSALDRVLNRRVAIKEYMPGEFSTRMPGNSHLTIYGGEKEEQFQAGMIKFHDESVRLSTFTEVPGIVQVFDCFYENKTAYIVMEYLEGETLDELIKRKKRLTVEEAVDIISRVLESLETVHAAGMIHRDIAPNNIFLTSDGSVKLLDFGAARSATGSHSKSLTVMYKEGFTAEEQYRSNGDQGPWTDVYSVAATLYKAITGITPDGAMERKIKDELKPIGKYGVKVPQNIETAVMNALNVSAKKRTQSAEQFLSELKGSGEVKKHFERTKESGIAHIPLPVWIIGGVLIAASVIVIILQQMGILYFHAETFANLFVPEGKVRMMNVVNMEEDEARERLEHLGLTMELEDLRYDNEISPGRIITQSVNKGELVDAGSVVSVVVSREAVRVAIPEVVGLDIDEAESLLKEQALKWEISQTDSIYPAGTIVSCDPEPKRWLYQGETVSLSVSLGMSAIADSNYTLNDLTGMTEDEARQMLAEQGVYLIVSGTDTSDVIPAGGIIGQSVAAGDIIHSGSSVNVTISEGRKLATVPDVVGMNRDDAVELLESLGLDVTVASIPDMETDVNTVIDQSIKSGMEVRESSAIEIYIPRRLADITFGTVNRRHGLLEWYEDDSFSVVHYDMGTEFDVSYHTTVAVTCIVVEHRTTRPYDIDEICKSAYANYKDWFGGTPLLRTDGTLWYTYWDDRSYPHLASGDKVYFLVLGVDRNGNALAYGQYELIF